MSDISTTDPIDERAEAEHLRTELDEVEAALARLDDGTYGTCRVCGAAIPDAVLEQRPQAGLCGDHQG